MTSLRSPWIQLQRWRRKLLVGSFDHADLVRHVEQEGTLAPRFAFMTILSSGIATLGLLQNSVAVIIGAMLISPLMGPIVQLGIGLAIFDLRPIRRALTALLVGLALGLAMATLIVWLSPLKDATPEIVARTEPNLFDLLIAVFSGLAGAYATVTRKGETIVGVAIATALMPPLAVVGYGLALGNQPVAGGAAFLFMTNLLAIALSVTIVARIYGIKGTDSPGQSVLQASLIVGVFVVLSLPLGLALRKIVIRTHTEHTVRSALDRAADAVGGRVTTLHVDSGADPMLVDAVFMTPRFVPGLDRKLEEDMHLQLRRTVQLDLREVVTTSDDTDALRRSTIADLRKSVDELESAATAKREAQQARDRRIQLVRDSVVARLGVLHSLDDGATWELRLRSDSNVSLADARSFEQAIRREDKEEKISVIPPVGPLLPIAFARKDAKLDDDARRAIAIDAWAVRRWSAAATTVSGFAVGRNKALAQSRADAVAAALRGEGVAVSAATGVTVRGAERKPGMPSPDRAEIAIGSH